MGGGTGKGERAREIFSSFMRRKRHHDSLRVISFLNGRGVDYVVLKGISLSYFDGGREFGDLDILVARQDAERVAGLLISEFGYRYAREEELAQARAMDENAHDISLTSATLIPVEIHYKLFNYMPHGGLDLLGGKTFLELDGVRIPCQSGEMQLLEVMLHNAYNHFFLCDREKWVRDINTVIDNHPVSWPGFIALLERSRQKELAYIAIWFLHGSAKSKVRLPARAMAMMRPSSPLSYLKRSVLSWALCFAWDRMFPPKDILQKRFNVHPDSGLFIFCYPANLIRLAGELLLMPLRKPIKAQR